jgi:hypothetical protein
MVKLTCAQHNRGNFVAYSRRPRDFAVGSATKQDMKNKLIPVWAVIWHNLVNLMLPHV